MKEKVKPTIVAEYKDGFIKCPWDPTCYARLNRLDGDEAYDLKLHLLAWGIDQKQHELRWRDEKRRRK